MWLPVSFSFALPLNRWPAYRLNPTHFSSQAPITYLQLTLRAIHLHYNLEDHMGSSSLNLCRFTFTSSAIPAHIYILWRAFLIHTERGLEGVSCISDSTSDSCRRYTIFYLLLNYIGLCSNYFSPLVQSFFSLISRLIWLTPAYANLSLCRTALFPHLSKIFPFELCFAGTNKLAQQVLYSPGPPRSPSLLLCTPLQKASSPFHV